MPREASGALRVVCAILRRGGKMLVSRRAKGSYAGYWEFPGGKVEPGESLEYALAREAREELGVGIERPVFWKRVRHAYPKRTVDLHVFFVDAFSGEPRPLEGQRLRWITPGEGLALPFLPADLPLLREAAQREQGAEACIS